MPDYIIISPVRDEDQWIARTIESVAAQTILPREYILVDDASRDQTVERIQHYAGIYPWIRLIALAPRPPMSTPEAVVRAFNIGYDQRQTAAPDYLVKLDGDLQFGPDFFAKCFMAFENDPRLGITGGVIRTLHGNRWVPESVPLHHVRGATKVYRWACWLDIGGFVPRHGWDGIDILRAQMKGWQSRHLPHLLVDHYRPTGKRQGGVSVRIDRGRTSYYLGSHPLFVLITSLRRMVDWPYITGGLAILYGYLSAWTHREPQIDDPELIAFNRRQQIRRMTFGRLGRQMPAQKIGQ
jgi:biofilm PGA synthesis N-glycosyltransferase PgaC